MAQDLSNNPGFRDLIERGQDTAASDFFKKTRKELSRPTEVDLGAKTVYEGEVKP